jgi:ketosteroid isomerase-like protein
MDAETAARAWIEGWTRAWPVRDADAIAALYTEHAVYSSHPFREPYRGTAGVLDYLAQAFADEELVACRFGEPVAFGNRAAVEYWAVLGSHGGEETIAGVSVLRFAPDGRCEEHRDYWALVQGSREAPEGWGC